MVAPVIEEISRFVYPRFWDAQVSLQMLGWHRTDDPHVFSRGEDRAVICGDPRGATVIYLRQSREDPV